MKLLAHRVAHAHVQLAKVQRWWKRRRRELAACRVVLCRLWEQEVDRRVGAKVTITHRLVNHTAKVTLSTQTVVGLVATCGESKASMFSAAFAGWVAVSKG